MAEKKYCIKTETLAGFAKALGHPARIAIMKFLAKQNTCYFGDIHEELPIAKATVSQHLSAFMEKFGDNEVARVIVERDIQEADFYKKYKDYYSYGFYIAQKL